MTAARLAPRGLRVLGSLALLTALLTLAPVPPGHATDGRDFAGFYEVSNVTDLGDTVRVTLTVRIFNYSDADVANATVTLQDSAVSTSDYGSYPDTVSIPDRGHIRLSADFTVSREEYDHWQSSGKPSLRIDYADSSGNAIQRSIELASLPVGEE